MDDRLARVVNESNRDFQGLTIADISRRRGTDPETTVPWRGGSSEGVMPACVPKRGWRSP